MRSHMARVCSTLSLMVLAAMIFSATEAAAIPPMEQQLPAHDGPFHAFTTPVGLAAIGLGVTGMVAGVLRRKKATVPPENQRR